MPGTDWPPELDALVAAPDQHKLLFENDHVRVIDTIIPAGTTVPLHTHCWPATYYVLAWSDIVRYGQNGEVQADSRTNPNKPQPGQAIWAGALDPHTVHNVGDQTLRIISVEIKGANQPI